MHCPFCGHRATGVTDSRLASDGAIVRRRRQCPQCHARFSTYETRELLKFQVRKKNRTLEPYSREKLEMGIRKALEKRPISEERIRRLISSIEHAITHEGKRVIPSANIGKAVMEHLRAVDEVAYIRFASVYRDFKSVRGFDREIKKL
ncbi:MAG: transcriptional repressor NrdR, partial [Parcubacteria group bacterium]|nr:transcriptional repressor NrdR [Parcubacteria group bacterium]